MRFTFEEFAQELKRDAALVPRVTDTIRRVVKLHGPRAVQRQVDETKPLVVDRGTYRRSFHYVDIEGGAAIYNSSPHGAIVEHGRRPGARPPPLAVIVAWVIRKGLVLGTDAKGKIRRLSRLAPPEQVAAFQKKAERIAWAIRAAIAKRGLPGHYVLGWAGFEVDQEIRRALRETEGVP